MAELTQLKFSKVDKIPAELVKGTVYFETSTGTIKVATSESALSCYSGVTECRYVDGVIKVVMPNRILTIDLNTRFLTADSLEDKIEEITNKLSGKITEDIKQIYEKLEALEWQEA